MSPRPDAPHTPTSPSWPGPTWDRGPHIETALARLELVLVVKQHEVGPGNGAVLGKKPGGSGPATPKAYVCSTAGWFQSGHVALPSPRLPMRQPGRSATLVSYCSRTHPTLGFLRKPHTEHSSPRELAPVNQSQCSSVASHSLVLVTQCSTTTPSPAGC